MDVNRVHVVSVTVLTEDINILALFLYLTACEMSDIYFVFQPRKGRGVKVVAGKCVNIHVL